MIVIALVLAAATVGNVVHLVETGCDECGGAVMAISHNAIHRSRAASAVVHMKGMFSVEDAPGESAGWYPIPQSDGPVCEPCWFRHGVVRTTSWRHCTHGGAQ